MSDSPKIPKAAAIRDLFAGLTGAEVSVADEVSSSEVEGSCPVAVYVLSDGSVAGLATLSLPIAVALSAALGLVPQPSPEEVKAMDAVPENLSANLYELTNVFAQLLNSDTTPHVRLKGVEVVSGLEPGALEVMQGPSRAGTYSVGIADRSGTLDIFVK